ncbi:MAG: DEAD/DEAH box helicase [Candidatus Babeliaceae bacterium]|jgi:ATP-dependent RNA helicase DeaD
MKITFKDFNMMPEIYQVIEKLGFTEPTEIQSKAIPALLAADKVDIHGQAQTGTGKTLAFGLPLLHRIERANRSTQALIVAPTRELALQICDSMRPFAQALGLVVEPVYGGMSMEEQIRALKRGVHIVIGTPGRLNDHLRRKTLSLKDIKTLVLDEADIMLDMGFKDEIDEIMQYAPTTREIWLFSATVKAGISTLMNAHMKNPISVRVSKTNVGTPTTKQYFCVLPMKQRLNALCRFIECSSEFYAFIFCQTKILTSEIAEQLARRGYNVGALHGDMSQAQRNLVIKKFKNKEITILVATDVAARGIDIANLSHVVNFSLPEDHESYVHRVGRTGRAGKEGIAITFVGKSETRFIQMIQRKFNIQISPLEVPSRDAIIKGRVAQAAQYLVHINEQSVTNAPHAAIKDMLDSYSEAELRTALMYILHEKFLSSILKEEEISFSPARATSSEFEKTVQECVLSVGADDGLTSTEITQYLTETGLITEELIQKIRIIKRRTFVEVPVGCASALLDALRNTSLAGRNTRFAFVEEDENQQQRRNSGGGDFNNRRRSSGGSNNRRYGGYSETRNSGGYERSDRRRY